MPALPFFQSSFQTCFLSNSSFIRVPGASTCDIPEVSLLQKFMSYVLTACSSVINWLLSAKAPSTCNRLNCDVESDAAAVVWNLVNKMAALSCKGTAGFSSEQQLSLLLNHENGVITYLISTKQALLTFHFRATSWRWVVLTPVCRIELPRGEVTCLKLSIRKRWSPSQFAQWLKPQPMD